MRKDIKEAWLEGLKVYPKGRNSLRNENGYCCLGVLACVLQEKFPEILSENNIEIKNTGIAGMLVGTKCIQLWDKLPNELTDDPRLGFPFNLQGKLMFQNDRNDTFLEVSEIIKEL